MNIKVVFEPSEEGGYTAYAPALPGCVSEGDTLDAARENIREAILLWLEDVDGQDSPAGSTVEEIVL